MRFWSVLTIVAAVASFSGCKDKDKETEKGKGADGGDANAGQQPPQNNPNPNAGQQGNVPAGGAQVQGNGNNAQVNKKTKKTGGEQ